MRVGITAMLTDRTLGPVELAVEAESLGFDSLFLPEHTHMPVERTVVHPALPELPDPYRRTLDPFVALAMAAQATTTLELGTGILLLAQRDALVTAKAVATLDQLSGGRFVLGLGYGWNVQECEHHGVPWSQRREATHQRLSAMRRLWRDEIAQADDAHVRFAPSTAWPKPAGEVPVWLGVSAGPKGLAAVAEHADGWIPHGSSGLADGIAALRSACVQAGRDPAEVDVVPFGVLPDVGKLDNLASLGITRLVALVPDGSPEQMRDHLGRTAETLDAWAGPDAWRRSN